VLRSLKQSIVSGELDGDRMDCWREVRYNKLGLVTAAENERAEVGDDEAKKVWSWVFVVALVWVLLEGVADGCDSFFGGRAFCWFWFWGSFDLVGVVMVVRWVTYASVVFNHILRFWSGVALEYGSSRGWKAWENKFQRVKSRECGCHSSRILRLLLPRVKTGIVNKQQVSASTLVPSP
jgi:hypothetical protein